MPCSTFCLVWYNNRVTRRAKKFSYIVDKLCWKLKENDQLSQNLQSPKFTTGRIVNNLKALNRGHFMYKFDVFLKAFHRKIFFLRSIRKKALWTFFALRYSGAVEEKKKFIILLSDNTFPFIVLWLIQGTSINPINIWDFSPWGDEQEKTGT